MYISNVHICGCLSHCCHLIAPMTQTATRWIERAGAPWTYLGKLLKCCERRFQGNGADHHVSSAEEAGNDWVTNRWVNRKRALWWGRLNYGKQTEIVKFKVKAREVFRGEEKNNGASVKTTDKVGDFSSTIFKTLCNSFPKRDSCAKLESGSVGIYCHLSSKTPYSKSWHCLFSF